MSGKFDASGLLKMQQDIEQLAKKSPAAVEKTAKGLAARLLGSVIRLTPVGKYDNNVEFDADIPAKHVEFDTRDGRHVEFDTKETTKHVKFTAETGKKGGTLRRGWTSKTHEEAESGGKTETAAYLAALPVHTFDNVYVIELLNPVKYAPYVEYGHRTANKKGWVPGVHMLEKSMNQLNKQAPKVIERNLNELMKGALTGGK